MTKFGRMYLLVIMLSVNHFKVFQVIFRLLMDWECCEFRANSLAVIIPS